MKKIVIGLAVLVVLVAGVAFFLLSNLDTLVKSAIVDVGAKLTGTKVSVSSVRIGLSEGAGSIQDLEIANPDGFSSNPAIKLGGISVSLDRAGVMGNPIVIKEVVISAPSVRYELGDKGSNLDRLKQHMASPQASESAAKNQGASRKLVIDKLTITKGEVILAAPGLPAANATLGDIVLTNVGSGQGGVDEAQLGEQVLNALLQSAIHSASNLPGVLGQAQDQLKSLLPFGK